MIRSLLPFAASLGVIALSAAAQTPFCAHVPSDTPGFGPCSSIPLGGKISQTEFRSQRIQFVITAAELGNRRRTIHNLAFAPCGTGLRKYGRIRIHLAHQTGTLTTTFANNTIGDLKVFDEIKHEWPNVANRWNNIGLERAFDYDPARGNLLIDIIISNADFVGTETRMRSDARQSLYAFGFSPTPKTGKLTNNAIKVRVCDSTAFVDQYGIACGSGPLQLDVTGTPRIGGRLDMQLKNGNPSTTPTIGVFLFGVFKNRLGVDQECTVYVNPFLVHAVPVTAGQSPKLSLPLPNLTGLVGAKLYLQGANQEPTKTKFGWALSRFAVVSVGG